MRDVVGKDVFVGLRKAVVENVKGDKSKCNYLTVKICSNGTILENVPVAFDMASKNFGRVVIPKKGDNVVVGFFDANFEQPVVLGSFYDKNKKPPIDFSKKDDINYVNYFQTTTGLKMRVDDSKDKAGIYIETKDKHKLELQDGSKQLVQVKNKDGKVSFSIDLKTGEVEIKCKSMKVTADDEITMKAGSNELSIKKSSGVDIKSSNGKINMSANQIAEKANADVKIDGANIKLNATAQLDAKANAAANFKSSGMTSVGGSLVKIG